MPDGWKTLRVPAAKYEQAKTQKEQHNRTWGEQLVTDEHEPVDVIAADEIDAGGLSYDDVENACRAALRAELPEASQ